MSLRRNLILLLRWHRRIALVAALFVVLLAVTGILLNHSAELGLDQKQIHSARLAQWYGMKPATATAFQVGSLWITHDGIKSLYLNDSPITECAPPLHGVIRHQNIILALCEAELLSITPEGILMERINAVFGLPEEANAIGMIEDQLFINTAAGAFALDLNVLEWTADARATNTVDWVSARQPPPELKQYIQQRGPGISLERLILHIHSGRLLGNFGVYLIDAVAILFILLALSGTWAWFNYLRLRKKERSQANKRDR